MKKFVRIMSVVLCVVLLAGAFAACGKKKSTDKLVIGMSGPLTGEVAQYGIAVQNGAQMAVDEINAKGGVKGVQIEFVAMDDKADGNLVTNIYASLKEKGMQVSLGTVTTGACLEFKNLAKDDNMFFMTPSASNDSVPEFANGYQMCFADGNQGKVAAAYVNQNYAGKTIGVLYRQDDAYSKGIFDQFKAALSGVEYIAAPFNGEKPADLSSQINLLKDCEFIFMPIYYGPAQLFMTQAKDIIAKNAVYYGCDGLDGLDKKFDISIIPQEISILSHFNSKATEGKAKEFIDKYKAKYNDAADQFAASAYDCVYAICEALEKTDINDLANASASDICEALKAQFNGGFKFSGVTGPDITWDFNGYVQKDAVKYVIKNADAD